MLTNHTGKAKVSAKALFNRYYSNTNYKRDDYVPYTDPSAILHWLGTFPLPLPNLVGGAVMKIHKTRELGMVLEYSESYGISDEDIDMLFKIAIAVYQLNLIEWDSQPITFYEWGSCDISPLDMERVSVFVKELFKHNVMEVS